MGDIIGGLSVNGLALIIVPFLLAVLFITWLIIVSRQRRGVTFSLRGLGVTVDLRLDEMRSRAADLTEKEKQNG